MIDTIDRLFQQISATMPEESFALRLWDGSERRYGPGSPRFTLTFQDEAGLLDVVRRAQLGFGEAYMRGDLDVEGDFQLLLRFAFEEPVKQMHLGAQDKLRLVAGMLRGRKNKPKRARDNVVQHYDLGNDFYELWLDRTMTYSCAYWDDGCHEIDAAQEAKYEHICRKLELQPGERLVDIGCGWGGMLEYAAKHHGVSGVGYTLSEEQSEFARERFRREGLGDLLEVRLQDYREAQGKFDKFVSIGMFEHVGKEYFDAFFAKTRELLVAGGTGVLHTIGRDRENEIDPWVQKYIFPGGYLPSLGQLADGMGNTQLCVTDVENLRLHYARTLDEWAARFEKNQERICRELGERFFRMWRLYLHGSAVAFKWGEIRLFQVTFTNGLRQDAPMTRAHLYH